MKAKKQVSSCILTNTNTNFPFEGYNRCNFSRIFDSSLQKEQTPRKFWSAKAQ